MFLPLVRWLLAFALVGGGTGTAPLSDWQEAQLESYWQRFYQTDGVTWYTLLHRRDEGGPDTLQILVRNENDYAVAYRFRPVFRSPAREWEADAVEGRLPPGHAATGTLSGLSWTPFPVGEELVQVGLRGVLVGRVR